MTQTIKNGAHRIAFLFLQSDLYAARFACAMSAFLWSVALLWPGETFARPTYTVLAQVMPETAWALVFLLVSVTQFFILFSGKYDDRLAVWFSAINAALWAYVVISMYLSVYPPPAAISGEVVVGWLAMWVYIRSGWRLGKLPEDAGDAP